MNRKWIVRAGLVATVAWGLMPCATAGVFDQDAVLARMRADGVESLSGSADDTGFWVVASGTTTRAGKSQKQAREAARLEARANLAKFFSSKVSAGAQSAYEESDGASRESFAKWARSSTEQQLAGVRIIACEEVGDEVRAFALLAQKTVDASAQMKAALDALPPGTVRAKGEGATRKAAIESACRSALEQVNGVRTVARESASDDSAVRSRVSTDVQGLVSAYRVLDEKQADGLWHVEIVATIDKDELQESYGAQLKSMGDPLFYICGANDDSVKQMSDYFIGKGFKTTTHQGTADYKIELLCKFDRVNHPINGKPGTQLQLSAVCYDKAGVQLFSLQNDPRKAATFVGTDQRQTQICVEKAVRQVGKPLHSRLQRAIGDLVNNGRTVRLVFRNATQAAQVALIERAASEINAWLGSGTATVSRNDAVAVSTLRLTLKGNPQDFLDELRQRVPELPAALSVSVNKITFEF